MTVANRLWHARFAPGTNAYGPTPDQRESYRIGRAQYDGIVTKLNDIASDYETFKAALDEAKVPWTPGRILP